MRILALDSTALSASVALCEDERLIAELTLNTGHTHSETLLPLVEAALDSAGMTVADIDLFAVTAGPGSFTGVRIGVATVKGLAFGQGKPCVGVSTLEALAHNGEGFEGILCPAMNARREQVYQAFFRSDGQTIERLSPDKAWPISEVGDELHQLYPDEPIWLMGDGASLVYNALRPTLGDRMRMLPERLIYQSGYNTAKVALAHYRAGEFVSDAELAPTYLRPSQAERTRMEKLGAEGHS